MSSSKTAQMLLLASPPQHKKYKSTAFLLGYVQCILLVKNFLTPFPVVQVLHLKYRCATTINKLMIKCVYLRRYIN